MIKKIVLFGLILQLLIACSMSMVIKPPIQQACASKGLMGCDNIADGIVYYVDGEKEKGVEKFIIAAKKNSPQKIQDFLREISKIPQVKEFVSAIMKEIDKQSHPVIKDSGPPKDTKVAVKPKTSNITTTKTKPEEIDNLYQGPYPWLGPKSTSEYSLLIHHNDKGEILNCWYEKNIKVEWWQDSTIRWFNESVKVELKKNYIVINTKQYDSRLLVDLCSSNRASRYIDRAPIY